MKILVTGGTVFVSKYVAEYFIKQGNEVYVLNRNTKQQPKGAKLLECDRRAPITKLKGLNFDALIDVTAYTAQDINILLDGLESFNNYVMISSSAVYPQTLSLPFKVGDKCGPNKFWGAYGTNKLAAEEALLKRVPNAYILRPPYIYGEYNNVYREAFVFDCAERNLPFYLPKDGQMPLQFLHIEDLCEFIEILLKKQPQQNIYNVGNSKVVSVREWVELCYAATGKAPVFKYVNDGTEQRNYFPFYNYAYYLDVVAQDKLKPCFIPLADGLKRAYAWYRIYGDEIKRKDYLIYISKNFSHS